MMSKQRKHLKWSLAGLLALCLLASLVLSACGGPPAQQGSNNPLGATTPTVPPSDDASADAIMQQTVTGSADDALKYWTTDKMLNAIDAQLLDSGSKDLAQQAISNLKKAANSISNGQNPIDKLPDIPSMSPQDLQDLLKQLEKLGLQGSTGTQTSASLLGAFSPSITYRYPLSTIGKVFFTANGRNWICSGTAVNSDNKSVVDTAGHCVYNGGWATRWIFCPMYYNGKAPYGCWAANEFYATKNWVNNRELESDYGLVVVHPNHYGKLDNKVGGTGWAYGFSPNQHYFAYGYPAQKPFNGQSMKSCEGDSTVWKYQNGAEDLSIPCDMNGGASGGGWLMHMNNDWFLNGHNDFISQKYPGKMFSPYYGSTWYHLYTKANSGDVGSASN